MSLTELAAAADLLAALGVIASLLFLALELRSGNRTTRQSNWRDLLDSYRGFKALTNDRDFAAFILRAQRDYDALSDSDRLSFNNYQEQGVHVMSNFFKHDADVPGELRGLEQAVNACLYEHLSPPGARAWLKDNEQRGRLMPGTYTRLRQVLNEGDATARKTTAAEPASH